MDFYDWIPSRTRGFGLLEFVAGLPLCFYQLYGNYTLGLSINWLLVLLGVVLVFDGGYLLFVKKYTSPKDRIIKLGQKIRAVAIMGVLIFYFFFMQWILS